MKRVLLFILIGIVLFFIGCAQSNNTFKDDYNVKAILVPAENSDIVTKTDWDKTVSTIDLRLKFCGVSNYNLVLNADQNQLILEFAFKSSSQSLSDFFNIICQKGELEYRDENNNILLDNNDIKKAEVFKNIGQYMISVDLNEQGAKKLAYATQLSGQYISVILDNNIIAVEKTFKPITTGKVGLYIENANFDYLAAVASIINSGPLPHKLQAQITNK